MMKYSRKNQLKQPEMQGNEVQNKRRESEAQKMHARQDRIIETQSQSGEMMIKNTQDKKENAKNESMLSEQYIHKKNIIQTQSQSGRSMVEMLGVLAIIGVLSIGGITGYKYAMNYYQANQIAHEINLMRTDAQIKIAQGVEELVLGNPYDDGNINFNNYETDFDCVYMKNENAKPDLAFCSAANAYYIEMRNIPEGVCRPLANLIDKMDNEIAFYINGKSVDAEAEGEKGACNEESNTLRVIFGADSDSDAIKCGDDTNCPPELPVCFNHMCVECETDTNCIEKDTNNPICNKNRHMCEPCPDGQKWQKTVQKCGVGECESNDDCNNGRTGYYCYLERGFDCNSEFNPNAFGEGKSGYASKCHLVEEDIEEKEIKGHTYYFSKNNMTWWTASERFCQQALNSKELTLGDLGCADMKTEDLCQTEARKELYYKFSKNVYVWLDGGYTSCRAYLINLWTGYVDDDARHDDYFNTDGHALCVQ